MSTMYAQAVMSGTQDCVIAGGVEIMSLIPLMSPVSAANPEFGLPLGTKNNQRKYAGHFFSQFRGGEIVAQRHNITREDMDQFARISHTRAYHATINGNFTNEIIPIRGTDKNGNETLFDKDEGIKYPVDFRKICSLNPLTRNKKITAATSCQITDGASAVLICNERGLKKLGLRPRAKIIALAVVGSDPEEMLGGPIPATQAVLKKANMTIDQIDLYEVNEAFASVPLAWAKAVGADPGKLNVNGGALALGHPIGATGVKLMATLLNELERRGKEGEGRGGRYGLLTICEGGGMANAMIVERVWVDAKL